MLKYLETQGFQDISALLGCRAFRGFTAKTLHISLALCDVPMNIHIAIISEFHNNGSKEPLLWNSAAMPSEQVAIATCSIDIIIILF